MHKRQSEVLTTCVPNTVVPTEAAALLEPFRGMGGAIHGTLGLPGCGATHGHS
jgi:hypothetical protein